MAQLTWDDVGERFFEGGVDRGVIYIPSEEVIVEDVAYPAGFPWNGLTAVELKQENRTVDPIYYDGVKTLDLISPGEFSATLKAITYPDQMVGYDGYEEFEAGVSVDSQNRGSFNLSYRTKVGNDLDQDLGYKIHVIYNITAIEDDTSYATVSTNVAPIEFSWTINTVPTATGVRPASHIIFDSRKIAPDIFTQIENALYGSDIHDARLPPITELLGYVDIIAIALRGGYWMVIGPDDVVTMVDTESFEIDTVKASYIDADTYQFDSSW